MAQNSVSPSAVLDRIASECDSGQEKVELSDDEMEGLGIWTENYRSPDRQPSVRSDRDGVPVSYRLYDVSDVEGYGRGEYLAVEIHDKRRGERHTRPYAIGLGALVLTPAGAPGVTRALGAVEDVSARCDAEAPTPEQVSAVVDWLDETTRLVADRALTEGAWAFAFDGNYVWVEPEGSRWQGFDREVDRIGLSEEQRRVVQNADVWWPGRPRSIETTSSFAFKAAVTFERGEE